MSRGLDVVIQDALDDAAVGKFKDHIDFMRYLTREGFTVVDIDEYNNLTSIASRMEAE